MLEINKLTISQKQKWEKYDKLVSQFLIQVEETKQLIRLEDELFKKYTKEHIVECPNCGGNLNDR